MQSVMVLMAPLAACAEMRPPKRSPWSPLWVLHLVRVWGVLTFSAPQLDMIKSKAAEALNQQLAELRSTVSALKEKLDSALEEAAKQQATLAAAVQELQREVAAGRSSGTREQAVLAASIMQPQLEELKKQHLSNKDAIKAVSEAQAQNSSAVASIRIIESKVQALTRDNLVRKVREQDAPATASTSGRIQPRMSMTSWRSSCSGRTAATWCSLGWSASS